MAQTMNAIMWIVLFLPIILYVLLYKKPEIVAKLGKLRTLGLTLGIIVGVLSLIDFTESLVLYVNPSVIHDLFPTGILLAWYLIGCGLSFLMILGGLITFKGRSIIGGLLMLISSLSFPTILFLQSIMPPVNWPHISMILRIPPLSFPIWLFLGLPGGLVILRRNRGGKKLPNKV